MKKVILFAAVAATVALASCGKSGAEAPAVDSMAVDTMATEMVDTTAAMVDTAAVAVVDSAAVAVAE